MTRIFSNLRNKHLQRMDQGDDAEIITNIFEVQILQRFGIAPIWTHCVVCGETKGKFDYSSKYGGVICERHWSMDDHRYHADPRAVYFVRMFQLFLMIKSVESI